MLVINNGYGKSGTTWIQRGLTYYFDFATFEPEFQNADINNSSVAPEKILSFIRETDLQANDYYSKSHWAASMFIEDDRRAQALVRERDVVVINSVRNIGDSLVSWYHHQKRQGETAEFDTWFWSKGARFVKRYLTHHLSWSTVAEPPFLFSYENMKRDVHASFAAFRESIGLADDRPPEEFNEFMDFKAIKAKKQSVHMRKGIVGDWLNYLSDEMIDHIDTQFSNRSFFVRCESYFDAFGVDVDDLRLDAPAPVQAKAATA